VECGFGRVAEGAVVIDHHVLGLWRVVSRSSLRFLRGGALGKRYGRPLTG
jgi:hypothetical protein